MKCKTCNTCKIKKPLTDFRVERLGILGRQARCRKCKKIADHAAYLAKGEPEKLRKKRWRRSNIDIQRECDRKWRKQNPDKIRAKTQRRAPEDPIHRVARNKANAALKKGILIKPNKCSQCGNKAKLYGHHSDYSKPLNVEGLCAPCHRNEHLRLEEAA